MSDANAMRSILWHARNEEIDDSFIDEDLIGSADANEPDPYDEEDEFGVPKRLYLSSLAKYGNPDRLADLANLPDRLQRVPGFLDMLVEHYMATARKPQRTFAVITALTLGSTVCSRVWITDNENFPNLFINVVGESGAGKEHPKKFIQNMLYEAGLEHLLGPRSYSASAGVRSYLYRHPRHVIIYDEFGKHLSITKASQDTNRMEVRVDLIEIFGQLDGRFTGKSYSENSLSEEKLQKRLEIIEKPAITLLGLTTPSTFFEALTLDDVKDGFLARFLVIQSNATAMKIRKGKAPETPEAILGWMQRQAHPYDDEYDHDYHAGYWAHPDNPTNAAEPKIVEISEAADELFDHYENRVIEWQTQLKGTELDQLLSRTHEISMRVALIVARSCESDVIEAEHAAWAIDLCERLARFLVKQCQEQLNRHRFAEMAEKLNDDVYRAGEKGLTFGRLRNINPNTFKTYGSYETGETLWFLEQNHKIKELRIQMQSGQKRPRYIHPDFLSKLRKEKRL